MANWYNTEFTITGNPADLASVKAILDNIRPDQYGELWLVEIAKAIGCDLEKTFCTGYIDGNSLSYSDGRIDFVTCSKWQPPYQVIYVLCKQFESLRYYFMAHTETYQTNDADGLFYPDRVYVDLYFDDYDEEQGFKTEREALEWVSSQVGRDFKSEEEVKNYFDDEEDSYCVINHVVVIPENEQLTFWSEESGIIGLYTLDGTKAGEITLSFGRNRD